MNVPFLDFSEQYNIIKDEIHSGLDAVFQKGNFILGEEEKAFEEEFARYCEAPHCVGVNSGTDALYLALAALDIQPGDEVILPTFTFIATALCVSYAGAKPVFVDVEDETYNLDPAKLEAVITDKTKVIIPVHLYGQPANMEEILAVAKKHGLKVVEDAAQAHGARYQKKRIGSLGDIACFSFYPTKSLGGFGDGGAVVTSDRPTYEALLKLRDYGRVNRYEHSIKGYNSRLDTVQAVVLSAKLKRLDEWNRMRNTAAGWYEERLADRPQIRTPKIRPDRTHVFQTYAVRVPNRDNVIEEVQKKGVGALIHYPIPVHLQPAYKELNHKKGDFPVAEKLCSEVMSLPMFPHITEEQVERVAQVLKSAL